MARVRLIVAGCILLALSTVNVAFGEGVGSTSCVAGLITAPLPTTHVEAFRNKGPLDGISSSKAVEATEPEPPKCAALYLDDANNRLAYSPLASRIKPECIGCGGVEGKKAGTIASKIPTTSPVSGRKTGLPLWP